MCCFRVCFLHHHDSGWRVLCFDHPPLCRPGPLYSFYCVLWSTFISQQDQQRMQKKRTNPSLLLLHNNPRLPARHTAWWMICKLSLQMFILNVTLCYSGQIGPLKSRGILYFLGNFSPFALVSENKIETSENDSDDDGSFLDESNRASLDSNGEVTAEDQDDQLLESDGIEEVVEEEERKWWR